MANYIDLFAGCGGLSLGLKKSGWTGLFAIEKNKDAFETFKHNLLSSSSHYNWPEWLPKSNLDINEVLEKYSQQLKELRGKVDLVAGGPPCQGFSLAGKRKKDDIRNSLVHAYIDFVELVKPKIIFFENVNGFTIPFGSDKVPFSTIIKEELENFGYNIIHSVVDVSQYGVPQTRKRFILIGLLDIKCENFFELLKNTSKTFLSENNLHSTVYIEDAISDLLMSNGVYKQVDFKKFNFGKYGEINGLYQTYMRKNAPINPDSHRFANHKDETIELFKYLLTLSESQNRMTPKKDPTNRLKKRSVTILKEGFICGTVTSIPDDYIHYLEPRIMTVREMARIQSFPDDYIFMGKYTTGGKERKKDVPRYTQIANAVPPLFAEQIGKVLKNIINGD